MSVYEEAVWRKLYGQPRRPDEPGPGESSGIDDRQTVLSAFGRLVGHRPSADLLYYGDGALTAAEVNELSNALAAGLQEVGFGPGDRAVIYMQNVPQFVLSQLAVWKAGGAVVSANPMYKDRELAEILRDSGATVLISLQRLYLEVAAGVIEGTAVRHVITTSELEYQTSSAGVLKDSAPISCPETVDMATLIERLRGATPQPVTVGPDDLAVLTYTSGTTGPPKGAMTTHRNLIVGARNYRDWVSIGSDDVILGVAPLFHITGIVGHTALALITGAPLVLIYRFEAQEVVASVAARAATFTVCSITVFIAMMNAPNASAQNLSSLRKIYSGGAPIAPGTLAQFRAAFGHSIHNIYGLTETTSPAIGVPFGMTAPTDEATGSTSVGIPVYDTIVRVIDDSGNEVAVGESGELVIGGPQVVPGYWNKPEATAEAIGETGLRTGDIGFMNADGWFFLIDRKKDQINASGFKVWPREVEDVLYEHAAVREVAVVGVPDDYRGETVKAFVSLRPGESADTDELIAFAKERLAAYKVPRQVEIIDDVPKTASGKILRRKLKDIAH